VTSTINERPTPASLQGRSLQLPPALSGANLADLTRDQLLEILEANAEGGTTISFSGKTNARRLARKVRPRVTRQSTALGSGAPADRAKNLLIDGDNLQSMATLYRERGRIDLIVTDPPYNTGQDFRYNDRWEEDPNDPGLGEIVREDDASRHTKWMRFMWPRLQMMKSMLRPGGVLAICIDHRELFRLASMLDELFRESNRIALINWEKSAAVRSDNSHVSTSTEYVLVYAKDIDKAETRSLDRPASANKRYSNPDQDPEGLWREGNLTVRTWAEKDDYAIQSPFTGALHYPAGEGAWRHPKRNILTWLQLWGVQYEERDIGDDHNRALMIQGGFSDKASSAARKQLESGPWPFIWFGRDGLGRPRTKTYLQRIRKGKVPVTYWADDEFTLPLELGCTSWDYSESGRSADGVSELTAIVGPGHNFTTVKPLKLMMKIIQLWCPPDGAVLDPFAGSGTTGHAVMALNHLSDSERRFILVEQGRPESGDSYAATLTSDRLRRAVSGDWHGGRTQPLPGGFAFRKLGKKVDAGALLKMERDEMVDTVIASHFDATRRRGVQLIELGSSDTTYKHLVARNTENEGFFLVWEGADGNTDFTEEVYEACFEEAERAGLKSSLYHVYARKYRYQTDGVRFYQIPDRILADFGLDLTSEPFSEPEDDQ
jgi:adenine-specific DNA-methyltransferase